jgi:hypothetical protein
MTANELADKLGNILTFLEIEYADYEDAEILKQASTMLRQQQAEIEALGKAFEGERKYARYLSELCINNKIPIVWSF